jgi:hypothetical protein
MLPRLRPGFPYYWQASGTSTFRKDQRPLIRQAGFRNVLGSSRLYTRPAHAAGSRRQHANRGRPYDLGLRDSELRCAFETLQDNHVVGVNGMQRAEVGVAMRLDSNVAAGGE